MGKNSGTVSLVSLSVPEFVCLDRCALGIGVKQAVVYVYECSWASQGTLSGKDSACQSRQCRDEGSVPELGRSPREGNGNPLQYSCLRDPMDRGAWQAADHGSQRNRHSWASEHTHTHCTLLYMRVPTGGGSLCAGCMCETHMTNLSASVCACPEKHAAAQRGEVTLGGDKKV